jgi:hypothetical protein
MAGLNTDLGTVNTNSGGASSVEGASPASSGVWDYTNPSGLSFWDGAGIGNYNVAQTSTTTGVTAQLFYVTGGGTIASKVSTVKEGTAFLSASGLVLTGAPVPLPPAVWLLGSGLLGLAGVARRKAKA